MLSFNVSRNVFLAGTAIALALVVAAFLIDGYAVLLFLSGLVVFTASFFASQVIYSLHRLKEIETEGRRRMVRCSHCEAPLYPEETKCPYCGTRRPETPQD